MSTFTEALVQNSANAANTILSENGAVLAMDAQHPGVTAFTKIVRDTSLVHKTGKIAARYRGLEKYVKPEEPVSRRRRRLQKVNTKLPPALPCAVSDLDRLESLTSARANRQYVQDMLQSGNPELVKDAFLLAAHKRAVTMTPSNSTAGRGRGSASTKGRGRSRGAGRQSQAKKVDTAGGEGERLIWAQLTLALYEEYPDTTCEVLATVPTYGSWRDMYSLWQLACYRESRPDEYHEITGTVNYQQLKLAIIRIIYNQLVRDLKCCTETEQEQERPSLLIKWFAREGSAMDRECTIQFGATTYTSATVFARLFFHYYLAEREFTVDSCVKDAVTKQLSSTELRYARTKLRQSIATLNKRMNTFETLACSGQWSKIDPTKVPSRCMLKQTRAFLNEKLPTEDSSNATRLTTAEEKTGNRYPDREDRVQARQNLINSLTTGDKIKVAGTDPHEILKSYTDSTGSTTTRLVAEAQWHAKVDEVFQQMQDMRTRLQAEGREIPAHMGCLIGMSDVSGSMSGTPMDVSVAFGILLTYLHEKLGQDPVAISFTDIPRAFNFAGKSLRERYDLLTQQVGYSTNFEAALDLVLDAIKKSGQHRDLIVFTDGQFNEFNRDGGRSSSTPDWTTCHQRFLQKVATLGLDRAPRIIYWNLKANTPGVQTRADFPGVQFLQGYSAALMRYVLIGESLPEAEIKVTMADGTTTTVKVSKATPYDTYRAALDIDRFDCVRAVLAGMREGALKPDGAN